MDYAILSRAWERNPVPKRVALAKRAGLGGKLGSKSWSILTEAERQSIASYLDKIAKAKPDIDGHHNRVKQKPQKASDYEMWVGTKYYPTYHDFVDEAREQGVSKRIGKVPNQLIPGKSRVFMAHDEGLIGQGFVFGYFNVERIEFITDTSNTPTNSNYVDVSYKSTKKEQYRKCGWREAGGVYLMGSNFYLLTHFRKFKHKHFRGALAVDGEELMASRDYVEAPSDIYKTRKKEPKWTSEQDEALLKAAKRSKTSRLMAFTIFAFQTGHSKSSVLYRYSKLIQKVTK